jgi:hypothetical protein
MSGPGRRTARTRGLAAAGGRPARAACVAVSLGIAAALLSLPSAVSAAAIGGASTAAGGEDAGRSLFDGLQPLIGRIGGHAERLPAEALACANCHRSRPGAPERIAGGGRDAGPVLNASTLLGAVERRGGPPSRYDRDGFCRALRAGVDPAGVVLPRVMPRYEIDAAGCDALWRFLTASRG